MSKQGRAQTSMVGSTKQEPVPKAVSESAVSQIGLAQGVRSEPLYEGRGLSAPMVGTTTHKSGSQGSH